MSRPYNPIIHVTPSIKPNTLRKVIRLGLQRAVPKPEGEISKLYHECLKALDLPLDNLQDLHYISYILKSLYQKVTNTPWVWYYPNTLLNEEIKQVQANIDTLTEEFIKKNIVVCPLYEDTEED